MMRGFLTRLMARSFSTVQSQTTTKDFVRHKPLEEFVPKGLQKLKIKEQQTINTSYKAGFSHDDVEPFNDMVKRALKLNNATSYEITQFKVEQAIKKFKVSPRDTGSASIQVAVRTERLLKQIKHCQDNRQDKYATKALATLLHERRVWINYLRYTDFHRYKWVCEEFCIPDDPPTSGHHKENFRLRPNKTIKIR